MAANDLQKSSGKLVVFEDKMIRRIFHNGEWYFSVQEGFVQLCEKIVQLKLTAPDGKMRETDRANAGQLFFQETNLEKLNF